jgi:hypothetical protein
MDSHMANQELKEVVVTGKSQDPVLSVQVDSIMLDVMSSGIMYHGMWLH